MKDMKKRDNKINIFCNITSNYENPKRERKI